MEDLIRAKLREAGDELLEAVREEVDACVDLGDVKRLGRLVHLVRMHLDSEVVRALMDRGFGPALTDLCEQVGQLSKLRRLRSNIC